MNLYEYCRSNSARIFDPFGLAGYDPSDPMQVALCQNACRGSNLGVLGKIACLANCSKDSESDFFLPTSYEEIWETIESKARSWAKANLRPDVPFMKVQLYKYRLQPIEFRPYGSVKPSIYLRFQVKPCKDNSKNGGGAMALQVDIVGGINFKSCAGSSVSDDDFIDKYGIFDKRGPIQQWGLKAGQCKPCSSTDLKGGVKFKCYGRAGAILGAQAGIEGTIIPWSEAEVNPLVVISAGAYLGAELCAEITGYLKKTIAVVD